MRPAAGCNPAMRLRLNHPDHIRCSGGFLPSQSERHTYLADRQGSKYNAAAYAHSHKSQSCGIEKAPAARTVAGKFSSEPGRQRVNLAAAKFNKQLSAMCRPLLSFSSSQTPGKSLGWVTHARVAVPRALAACVRRSLWNKNIVPPCLDGPAPRNMLVLWFRCKSKYEFVAS